jgi:hypothetical protein
MLVRFLTLICSLILVLPPGWCCLVPVRSAEGATARRCCGCPHCRRPDPAPKPAPVKPHECPCFDRQFTPPTGPQTLPAGAAMMAPLPPFEPAPAESLRLDRAAVHLADPPLHLTHCTWLC